MVLVVVSMLFAPFIPYIKSWVVLGRFGAGWLSLGTKASCPDFGLSARAGGWALERGIHPSSMSCVVLAARAGGLAA